MRNCDSVPNVGVRTNRVRGDWARFRISDISGEIAVPTCNRDRFTPPPGTSSLTASEGKTRGDHPIAEETGRAKQKRKKQLSPERKASMQMRGKYLGLLTRLPKNQRGKYRVIAKKEGREAAIVAMEKAAK